MTPDSADLQSKPTELMPDQSPYNCAFNNPVFWIDPDGMMPEEGDAGGGDLSGGGKVYTKSSSTNISVSGNSVTITSTTTNNVSYTTTDGVFSYDVSETSTTKNSTTITSYLKDNGSVGTAIESTETVSSQRTTEKYFNSREDGPISFGSTIESNIYGADGICEISIDDQPSTVKNLTYAIEEGMKSNINFRGVEHALSDKEYNYVSTAVGIAGVKYTPIGIGALIGNSIGNHLRADALESNFDGKSINITRDFLKFTFDKNGNLKILETLAERLGKYE